MMCLSDLFILIHSCTVYFVGPYIYLMKCNGQKENHQTFDTFCALKLQSRDG